MYSKKKIYRGIRLSLSHLLENIGFSTLEDTIAEMYVLAPGFYIFCGLFWCFGGFCLWTVLAERIHFNLQLKKSKISKSVSRAESYLY